jgi:hypothetical protein
MSVTVKVLAYARIYKYKPTHLGSTLYLLNQVAQTSAASSLKPVPSELAAGVGWVSSAQLLEPVMEAVVKGENASWLCRFAAGKSCTSS